MPIPGWLRRHLTFRRHKTPGASVAAEHDAAWLFSDFRRPLRGIRRSDSLRFLLACAIAQPFKQIALVAFARPLDAVCSRFCGRRH